MVAKKCTRCKKLKLLSMFGKDYTTIDGLKSQCKQCKADYYNQYKETNNGKMAKARSNTKRKMKRLGLDYFNV